MDSPHCHICTYTLIRYFINTIPMTTFSITLRNTSRVCAQRQTSEPKAFFPVLGYYSHDLVWSTERGDGVWNEHAALTYPFDLLEVQERNVPCFLVAGDDVLLPVHMEITGRGRDRQFL